MKNQKKLIMFAIGLFVSNATLPAVTAENVMLNITSLHTFVFGINTLLDPKINKDTNLDKWNLLMQRVGNYVALNAYNNNILSQALYDCFDANNSLINTIRIFLSLRTETENDVYVSNDENMKNKTDTTYKISIPQLMNEVKHKKDHLQITYAILTQTTFYTNKTEKDNARKVLIHLIPFLEVTMDKLLKDYNDLVFGIQR